MFIYSASLRGVPMQKRIRKELRNVDAQGRGLSSRYHDGNGSMVVIDSGLRNITATSEEKLRNKVARKLVKDGHHGKVVKEMLRDLDIVCKDTTASVDATIRAIEIAMLSSKRFTPPKIKFLRKRGRKTQQELDEQAFWLDSYDEVGLAS